MSLDELAAAAREALPLLLWVLGVVFVVVYALVGLRLLRAWIEYRAERRRAQRRTPGTIVGGWRGES